MAGGDVLVDTNVIVDLATANPSWLQWSFNALARAANESSLVINPLIYAEVSTRFDSIEEVEELLPVSIFRRDPLPYEAAFLAGKAFLQYRLRGGAKLSPLSDFYIGAHAAVAGLRLLTRDAQRFRTYFPTLEIIAPNA